MPVSTTTSPVPGTQQALDVPASMIVENEHQDGYQRELFAEGLDTDGDGCATRAEVLIRDTLVTPQIDPSGCVVLAGEWLSLYDGVTVNDPAALEVDHVVALKEAWDSGAWQWDDARRAEFANDLVDARTLRAVTGGSNASKGQADPSNWLPPNDTFVCTYLADWIAIKARWELSMDQSEFGRIRNVLTERFPEQTIAPWPATQPWTPTAATSTTGSAATTSTTVGVQPAVAIPTGDCDPSYPGVCIPPAPPDLDCGDVAYQQFTVLPPDPHNFDGDHNGVGCEG
jgi:hypothetical protein